MSKDYGIRSTGKRLPQVWIVIGVGVALGLAVIATVLVRNREAKMAEAASWKIDGPPCPSLTAEAFAAAHLTAKKMFQYDALTFGRVAGHASCTQVGADGGKALGAVTICQFTSPATLTVKTPKGAWFYTPGIGKPATVAVDKNIPRCVLAAKFTLSDGV